MELFEPAEDGGPGHPSGEGAVGRGFPGGEETPVVVVERKLFGTGFAQGAHVAGAFKLVERELNRAAEVAGVAGDFGGVAGFVGEQPGHDFGAGLATEESAEFEQEVAGVVHARRHGEAAITHGAAQPAVGEKIGIGRAEVSVVGEERRGGGRRRRGRVDDGAPFFVGGQTGEAGRKRGEHGSVAERVIFLQAHETLEVDPVGLILEPVQRFIEQSGLASRQCGGGEQEGLGVDDEIAVGGRDMAGDAEGGPLAPEEIGGGGARLGLKVGR